VPVQSAFFLGGPATVRGYHGAAAYGSAFWRGRAEVGTSFPAARLTLFGDAGWAGDRQDRRLSPQLVSAGIGGSFLDGLVRIDLARALERPTGWRLHFYVDGVL
jgi:hemolysin activation/secretion protein